jgi:hypothetical protein
VAAAQGLVQPSSPWQTGLAPSAPAACALAGCLHAHTRIGRCTKHLRRIHRLDPRRW